MALSHSTRKSAITRQQKVQQYHKAAQLLDLQNLHCIQAGIVIDWLAQTEPAGYVYAAQPEGATLVKIGRSVTVSQRLRTLAYQYGVPFTLLASVYCPCSVVQVEYWLHDYFKERRVESEWYACDIATFTEPFAFAELVESAHYEVLQESWRNAIVQGEAGTWVLSPKKRRAFLSL